MTAVIPASARLLVAVLSVALAAYLGSRATLPNIPGWYAGLAKPSFTPPNGVFGPVWAVLYAAMAVACWRILSLAPGTPGRARALLLFFVQLALNAAWSFAFFGARSPTLGLLVIIPLLASIAATIWAFRPLDGPGAWLLAPYLAWVAYATALNVAIWRLNP